MGVECINLCSIIMVNRMARVNLKNSNNSKSHLLWLPVVAWLGGCGGQPRVPVEEHSSIKPPPKKEIYYRASAVAKPAPRRVEPARRTEPERVIVTPARQQPITYQAVEPEPVWEEIPPPAEPAPRYPQQARVAKPQQLEDDPLLGMLQKIEQAMQQQEYGRAEGLLERALRIDSQRAGLWHDLAQVRYQQKLYQEAVTLARRSNSFADRGSLLIEENWSLIARSKEALGDAKGARAAWSKAGR